MPPKKLKPVKAWAVQNTRLDVDEEWWCVTGKLTDNLFFPTLEDKGAAIFWTRQEAKEYKDKYFKSDTGIKIIRVLISPITPKKK